MKNKLSPKWMALGAAALVGLLAGCQLFGKLAGAELIDEYTPENEYYMGRGVSATILGSFPSADMKKKDVQTDLGYLNRMGGYIYLSSLGIDRGKLGDHVGRSDEDLERKQHLVIQNGITVGILETDEIMAFSLPGGFMWFSNGILKACKDEDELAAIMCHEMGHLIMNHASDHFRDAQNNAASTAAVSKKLSKLTKSEKVELFSNSIGGFFNDIAERGYAKNLELEADNFGARALAAAGYDPWALVRVLERVDAYEKANGLSGKYLKNHPPLEVRIKEVKRLLEDEDNKIKIPNFKTGYAARLERFKAAISG